MSSPASPSPGRIERFFGVADTMPPKSERLLAVCGTLAGLAAVIVATQALLGPQAAIYLVPSLGASAILIFAAPHSLFAQPWPIIGGHLLSALAGVACRHVLPDPLLAAAAAVALALGVMHAARCLHPPGGGTALTAVLGGSDIAQLGFAYAVYPVGINGLLLVGIGIAFNAPFAWRRYPASLMRYVHAHAARTLPSDDELRRAMDELKVVVDVSPEELREVIERAFALAAQGRSSPLPASPRGPMMPRRGFSVCGLPSKSTE